MDVPAYKCGVRQEEPNKDKLADSYSIAVDSGYDSIYNGCSSVLMEKSFSRESFDIFSPNSPNRTPGKHPASTLKYHVSTPKNSASIKRHLYSSFNTSSLKRSKSENNENEPKTVVVNSSIRCKPDYLNDSACPLKALNNYYFSPQKDVINSTTTHQLSFINESDAKYSIFCAEDSNEQPVVPERPSKGPRKITPLLKHSKRKLDIPPVVSKDKTRRTYYFNGTLYLNIIGKLTQFPGILDDIFKRLSSEDLLHVSLVSKNWNSIVKSNRNANARIQHYLNESRNVKENLKEPKKPTIIQHERHPFSQFNIVSTSKKKNTIPLSKSFFDNQNVVEQLFTNERLVKCPRCNRGSIISDSTAQQCSTSLIHVPTTSSYSDSLSRIQNKSDSICNITRRDKTNKEECLTSEHCGVCTSLACKYMFCLKCLCDFHPGERCKISEPESPSKLLICHKKLKLKKESNSKLSSKRQSLRRLCFS